MRQIALTFGIAALFGSAGISALVAHEAVGAFEKRTKTGINSALAEVEGDWARLAIDGLTVHLSGTAPDERQRFVVLEAVSSRVAAPRIKDITTLASDSPDEAPDFAFEILRNGDSISLMGAVPKSAGLARIRDGLAKLGDDEHITNMLEASDHVPPVGWGNSVDFGAFAVTQLSQGKIIVGPGKVTVSGVAASFDERADLEAVLKNEKPKNVTMIFDVSSPQKIIAPFSFSFTQDDRGARLPICALSTPEAISLISQEITGLDVASKCDVGLGAPSDAWDETVRMGLETLNDLGGGSLEIVNADIALTAQPGTDEALFNAEVATLTNALPALYTLKATLPETPEVVSAEVAKAPHFTATRTEDGTVHFSGDLPDDMLRQATETFAESQFGFDTVINETELREDLPTGWSSRVLAGIGALALLRTGELEITPDRISLTGEAIDDLVEEEIRILLDDKLPAPTEIQTAFTINPNVVVPMVSEARAELCAAQIASLLANAQIAFLPGETKIDEQSLPVIDGIASILEDCPGARFEIGGHTDSQGRESSNLAISQARAASVLDALLDRSVDKVFLAAQGYGEAAPIAENETDGGRALNRRIEFRTQSQNEDGFVLAGEDDGTEVETDTVANTDIPAESDQAIVENVTNTDEGVSTENDEGDVTPVAGTTPDPAPEITPENATSDDSTSTRSRLPQITPRPRDLPDTEEN